MWSVEVELGEAFLLDEDLGGVISISTIDVQRAHCLQSKCSVDLVLPYGVIQIYRPKCSMAGRLYTNHLDLRSENIHGISTELQKLYLTHMQSSDGSIRNEIPFRASGQPAARCPNSKSHTSVKPHDWENLVLGLSQGKAARRLAKDARILDFPLQPGGPSSRA